MRRSRRGDQGSIEDEFPDALANASYVINEADASNPAILLRTVDPRSARLAQQHSQEVERILSLAKPRPASLLNLDAPDAYAWSLYHLLQNEDVIKNVMFPITYYRANGANWTRVRPSGRATSTSARPAIPAISTTARYR